MGYACSPGCGCGCVPWYGGHLTVAVVTQLMLHAIYPLMQMHDGIEHGSEWIIFAAQTMLI